MRILGSIACAALLVAACGVPAPAAPSVREVSIASTVAGAALAGDLYMPRGGAGGGSAGVLLLGVAGPNDRSLSFGDLAPFAALAERLQAAGVAVLTLDDRGVGGSAGSWAEAGYDVYVSDALAAHTWLAGRPGVDPERVGFFGLSEGSAVAMMAAAQRPEGVAFLILGSPPGRSGEAALRAQLEASLAAMEMDQAMADQWRSAFEEFLALARAGDTSGLTRFLAGPGAALVPPYAFVPQEPGAQARLFAGPWYRSQLDYDPARFLHGVEAPTLLIGGALDPILAPAANHPPILAGIGSADVRAEVLQGLNHLLLPARTGHPSEYADIDVPVDERVLALIEEWLTERGFAERR